MTKTASPLRRLITANGLIAYIDADGNTVSLVDGATGRILFNA